MLLFVSNNDLIKFENNNIEENWFVCHDIVGWDGLVVIIPKSFKSQRFTVIKAEFWKDDNTWMNITDYLVTDMNYCFCIQLRGYPSTITKRMNYLCRLNYKFY